MTSQAGLPSPVLDPLAPEQSPEAAREAWRAAAAESELAYAHWCDAARRRQGRMAFAVYRAAADRETIAAEVLARCA